MHVSASSSGSISFFSGEAWQRVEGATVHAVVSVSAIHLRSPHHDRGNQECSFSGIRNVHVPGQCTCHVRI